MSISKELIEIRSQAFLDRVLPLIMSDMGMVEKMMIQQLLPYIPEKLADMENQQLVLSLMVAIGHVIGFNVMYEPEEAAAETIDDIGQISIEDHY